MKIFRGKAHDDDTIGCLFVGIYNGHGKLNILSQLIYVFSVIAVKTFYNLCGNNCFAVLQSISIMNDAEVLIHQNNTSLINFSNLCRLFDNLLTVVIHQITGGHHQIGDHGPVGLQLIDTLGHQL